MINPIISKELEKSTKRLSTARKKEQEAWNEHVDLIKLAHEQGMSFREIGELTDVTKARVWQIVRNS